MLTYISTEDKPQCNTRKWFSCLFVWYSSVAIIVGRLLSRLWQCVTAYYAGGRVANEGKSVSSYPFPWTSMIIFPFLLYIPPPFQLVTNNELQKNIALVGHSRGKSLLTALKCAPSPPFYPLQFNGINLQRNLLTQPASDAAFKVLLLNSFCVFTSRQL